jgi:hypothetical protein
MTKPPTQQQQTQESTGARVPDQTGGIPDSAQTRQAGTVGASTGAKAYDQMTLEEKEAYLDSAYGGQAL